MLCDYEAAGFINSNKLTLTYSTKFGKNYLKNTLLYLTYNFNILMPYLK